MREDPGLQRIAAAHVRARGISPEYAMRYLDFQDEAHAVRDAAAA